VVRVSFDFCMSFVVRFLFLSLCLVRVFITCAQNDDAHLHNENYHERTYDKSCRAPPYRDSVRYLVAGKCCDANEAA
jgi:hypothetical protein